MKLYKYLSFEKFVDMIEFERLYLTKICLWEDPLEGVMYKKHLPDFMPFSHPAFNQIFNAIGESQFNCLYAQSWTDDSQESDAMWKIYGENDFSVRIEVERDSILDSLKESLIKQGKIVGAVKDFKVNYGYENFDNNKFATREGSGVMITGDEILNYKSKAYTYESEYRISFWDQPNLPQSAPNMDLSQYSQALLDIKTAPVIYYDITLDSIKNIILNPRAKNYQEDLFYKYCTNRSLNSRGITFSKSRIYEN